MYLIELHTAILPIPFFLEQIWLLLLTIAIEAIIIHKQLQLKRKTSIEYAIIINVFSAIFLSLVLIISFNFLNDNLRFKMIEYLLWGRLSFFQDFNQISWFVLITSIYFVINTYIELQIINFLQNILLPEFHETQLLESNLEKSELVTRLILLQILNIYDKNQQLKTVIIANFISMTILIFLHYCLFYLF